MSHKSTPPPAFANLKGLHVLVLEDDDALRELLADVFATCGAKVDSARSLAEARHCTEAAIPDVLLADFELPDGHGEELARELLQRGRVCAIALTGRSDEEDIDTARKAGFVAHARKPLDPGALSQLVATLART